LHIEHDERCAISVVYAPSLLGGFSCVAKLSLNDAEKLLKTVLDNQLIDTKGRWNYRAGWKILTGQTAAPKPKPTGSDKKDLADATAKGSAGGGDPKPKPYMTSADFKKDRPW